MKISIDSLVVEARGASASIDRELAPHICGYCGIDSASLKGYRIVRRSVDARSKPNVKILYRLEAELVDGARPSRTLEAAVPAVPAWTPPTSSLKGCDVIIVGAGPAGLFAAWVVAMAGGHPVVMDRGRDVERRRLDIEAFRATRTLDCDSNYLFGEGGAGTWSDGKLFTRVNDIRVKAVLDAFVSCGASETIGYYAHPHIGSDKLPAVVAALRETIIGLGGEFRWGSEAMSLVIDGGRCRGVRLRGGECLHGDAVIVACGHSAREFILAMIGQGVATVRKGFQIGVRIEHPQEFVNRMQYGVEASYPALGAAEYNVVARADNHGAFSGVTSFCMCPGGEVIPATCTENTLCTNGMSNSARDSRWANSALITTVPPETFDDAAQAYRWLEALEHKCFEAGGGDYSCPAQTAVDFCAGRLSTSPPVSSYCFGTRSARLDLLLPKEIAANIRIALRRFEQMHRGFMSTGVLLGVESRVSSPVRFLRNEATFQSNIQNLYFAGEGAGMAGGITSAAVDGMKMAEAIAARKGTG